MSTLARHPSAGDPRIPLAGSGWTCGNGGNRGVTTREYPDSDGEDRIVIHYRISTRIVGPKQTLSYIQVMVR